MIYSCFNERAGLYEYFENAATHPTNGDLPVPSPGPKAGKIGVPAMNAGRFLPSDAKRAGSGWHARGIVVDCKKTPLPGLGAAFGDNSNVVLSWSVVIAMAGAGYYYERQRKGTGPYSSPWAGAAAGAIMGASILILAQRADG
jgi:hypothetical protein